MVPRIFSQCDEIVFDTCGIRCTMEASAPLLGKDDPVRVLGRNKAVVTLSDVVLVKRSTRGPKLTLDQNGAGVDNDADDDKGESIAANEMGQRRSQGFDSNAPVADDSSESRRRPPRIASRLTPGDAMLQVHSSIRSIKMNISRSPVREEREKEGQTSSATSETARPISSQEVISIFIGPLNLSSKSLDTELAMRNSMIASLGQFSIVAVDDSPRVLLPLYHNVAAVADQSGILLRRGVLVRRAVLDLAMAKWLSVKASDQDALRRSAISGVAIPILDVESASKRAELRGGGAAAGGEYKHADVHSDDGSTSSTEADTDIKPTMSILGPYAQHHYSTNNRAIRTPQNWEDVVVATRRLICIHQAGAKVYVLKESQRAYDLAECVALGMVDGGDAVMAWERDRVAPGIFSLPVSPEEVAASSVNVYRDCFRVQTQSRGWMHNSRMPANIVGFSPGSVAGGAQPEGGFDSSVTGAKKEHARKYHPAVLP